MSNDNSSPSIPGTPANGVVEPGQVFAGHLGYLTKEQEDALVTFKEKLNAAKLYTPASEASPASHDDKTLLRFLRARSFDPIAAQKQFANAEAWRKQHDVDRLFATFDAEELETAKRFYPRWTGRRDRNGIPLFVYHIQPVVRIQNELDAVSPARRFQRIVALYEFMTRFTLCLASHLPHPSQSTPISSTTNIIDLQDTSLTSLWRMRGHFQESSQLGTANYPETIHTIAIVNSPSFFPTVWSWIKGWFDEKTRNKIFVLGKDPGQTLRAIVDPKDLPKAYGGELDWKYEDGPMLDEDAKAVIKEMPKGPAIFVDGVVLKPPTPSS